VGAATITGRGYALDAVGRRTGYVDETAANAVFSYDPAGQVLGGTVPVPGQPASVNTYAYDPEGNRTQSSTGIQPAPADPVTITGSTTYTANPLNQYTAITGNPAPTYDADGNLLSGLRSPLSAFTSTWNGENRMLSSTSANVAIADRRVENAYDALGRRVRKTVKFASTGAVIEDRYFIYDGWNVIEETIVPATGPVETAEAVWGTDLSGTAQGAGGVGGLLLRETSATGASYYHYDGNGNVTALTSAAVGVQAAYTYGPFGETLRAAGPLAQANPWRFSTKYQDEETGLLYYGYRFYNPTDGRWPSRDPIGEEGGENLYGANENDSINYIDLNGLNPLNFLREVAALPFDVLNGDLFRSSIIGKEFTGSQCQFLLTVVGVNSNYDDSMAHRNRVSKYPEFRQISSPQAVYNPTIGLAGDLLLQALGDETGTIGVVSRKMAGALRKAYEKAKSNGCPDKCIKIYIEAHSQGGAITANALKLVSAEIKNHVFLTTLGSQWDHSGEGLAGARNIHNKYDIVPKLPNQTSKRFKKYPIETFDPASLGFPKGEEDGPISAHTLLDSTNKSDGSYYKYREQHPWGK
jgi:RHS repeat-associated protein